MKLYDLLKKPAPYAASPSIWTDEHIAKQMLAAHIDPETDAASYRPERIDRICAFIWETARLSPGSAVIDVGCGPGLYASRLCARGAVTAGIDQSKNSIEYARNAAARAGQDIDYRMGDYREPFGEEQFDAAIMVSEDYGVLAPHDRRKLLENIHASLKPGGLLLMDAANDAVLEKRNTEASWYTEEAGFFRPHPHVVLKKTWNYPKERAYCDMYVVCDDDITAYYVYQTVYSPERITNELREAGFQVENIYSNLEGGTYEKGGEQVAVIARKLS